MVENTAVLEYLLRCFAGVFFNPDLQLAAKFELAGNAAMLIFGNRWFCQTVKANWLSGCTYRSVTCTNALPSIIVLTSILFINDKKNICAALLLLFCCHCQCAGKNIFA
jgi:hypothetical protein